MTDYFHVILHVAPLKLVCVLPKDRVSTSQFPRHFARGPIEAWLDLLALCLPGSGFPRHFARGPIEAGTAGRRPRSRDC